MRAPSWTRITRKKPRTALQAMRMPYRLGSDPVRGLTPAWSCGSQPAASSATATNPATNGEISSFLRASSSAVFASGSASGR